jgi:prepilin-type N-terminal cleavage/methylation domain-containing protein
VNATNHNAGFSLVEVMIAVLILGIALVGLTQGLTTALGSSKDSELQTVGALFAAGQIETLRAAKDLTDGTTNADCGAKLPLYRWKQTISPTDIAGLHDVDVVVENSQTGAAIYELRTLLFEPPVDSSGKSQDAKSKPQGQ